MGEFRNLLGLVGSRSTASILSMLLGAVALFNSGCSGLVTASNSGGGPPLTIANVAVGTATPTSVGVNWQTNSPASSQVEYGTTTSYGSTTALDSTMVTSHQLTVPSLKPGTTYHCRVHSTDAKNNSAVSGDLACPTPRDTTPPTVSITFPVANATLSGTVNLTATATDDVAVASVQFKVDTADVGSAISSAPYSYSLNTGTLLDGNHILTAMATDTSGNTATSTGITVKVNNATPAPSITRHHEPESGVRIGRHASNDHRYELWRSAGNERRRFQRDVRDADNLERDEHRCAGAGGSHHGQCGGDSWERGEQRCELHSDGSSPEYHESESDFRIGRRVGDDRGCELWSHTRIEHSDV